MNQAVKDELECLTAIYEDEIKVVDVDIDAYCSKKIVITLSSKSEITILLPESYPHKDSPCILCKSESILNVVNEFIHKEFTREIEFLYPLIERIRELDTKSDFQSNNEKEGKTIFSLSDKDSSIGDIETEDDDNDGEDLNVGTDFLDTHIENLAVVSHHLSKTVRVFKGQPVTIKKSTFLGFCCIVTNYEEVSTFYNKVLSDKRVKRATHNMKAYRFYTPPTSDVEGRSSNSGLIHHDCDDDGESAAGTKIAELIRLMNIVPFKEDKKKGALVPGTGLAVIVSRWYGGILLGPDRFKIINNVARELILDMLKFYGYNDI